MNKTIVLTTIQPPTEATILFSEMKDWDLIVVGDLKTPEKDYKKLNCQYISPSDQEKINLKLSDSIGWNSIQRRNFGYIVAYENGTDVLANVDDDNIPYENWGENLSINKEIEYDCFESENGYFDPLSATNENKLWHRGYPIELVKTKNKIKNLGIKKKKPLIQADLWDGDPDIDAICRLSMMPEVKYDNENYFGSEQLSPFNTQNTFFSREIIPRFMVIPHVGRMDDIWAAYFVQKEFPNSLIFGPSSVYQERNEQDLIKNLENELIGYRNTLDLLDGNYKLPEEAQLSYDLYRDSF